MPERQKIDCDHLVSGYEFPPRSYNLNRSMVSTYKKAVEESSVLYQDTELVPPMAVAARAMAALSEDIILPPGAIHVSQELEFEGTVSVTDTLVSYARVSRKQSRGKFHILTMELKVFNQRQEVMLTGKTSFILPKNDGGSRL